MLTSRQYVRCLLLLLCSTLFGCAMTSPYERPSLPVPGKFLRIKEAVKASSILSDRDGVLSIDAWRQIFIDPTLRGLIQLALDTNRDLRYAVLNVSRLQTQYQIKKPASSGYLGMNVGMSRVGTSKNASSLNKSRIIEHYSVGLSPSWEIDLFGQVKNLRENALMTYFGSVEGKRAAEISLVSGVAMQYLTWLASDAQVDIAKNKLETARELFRINRALAGSGVVDELARIQAETSFHQARADWTAKIRERTQAENALVLLVGQPLPKKILSSRTFENQKVLIKVPSSLMSDSLLSRPDILRAEYQLRAANANIGAARAAFFPKISLTGVFGMTSVELSDLFNSGNAAWQFLPKISLPIFNGGVNRERLKLAKIDREITLVEYERTIQRAFREVADTLAASDTYDNQIKDVERILDLQRRRLKLAKIRHETGLEDHLNLLTARMNFLQAKQVFVSVKLGHLITLVSLYQRLGGGWLQQEPLK